MKRKYICFDIESSGSTPGKYSMLSIGACIIGNESCTFYRELKPISKNYLIDAMRIGCLGLEILNDHKFLSEYNPQHKKFNPKKVLDLLMQFGDSPEKVMNEYNEWVLENTIGYKPVEVARPIKFDGMFTAYYFDNFFDGSNPFGHIGEDITSLYRGVMKDLTLSIKDLGLQDERIIPHNALDDALQQAKEFNYVLKLLK